MQWMGNGEKHYGGFSEYAKVNGDWLIHIPKKFTLKDSMIIGAVGYTASLCVLELIKYIAPNKGKILVTGSSGGVGSIAVNLLSKLDYHVVALSSKDTNFLLKIGANEVLREKILELQINHYRRRYGLVVLILLEEIFYLLF